MSANSNVTPTEAPTGPPTGTAAPAASSSGGGAGYSTSTTVSSLSQLKEEAPQVFNAMMEGIASGIITEMQDRQNEIHMMNIEAEAELEEEINS